MANPESNPTQTENQVMERLQMQLVECRKMAKNADKKMLVYLIDMALHELVEPR